MNKIIQRYFYFLLGLTINSFGIAFITKSALGTSQISSLPYVCSLFFTDISFGAFTFIFNMTYILLQILLLRKDFHPTQFLQIPANLLFSVCIDLGMYALSWFSPEHLVARIASLLVGCVILAFGICIEIAPNVITVPGEGIVRAIAVVGKMDFGRVKVIFDVTLIILSAILSLICFHSIQGVGLGTVVSALTVGKFVSFFHDRIPLIQKIEALDTD